MLKRVYAIVSDKDFYACLKRAEDDGLHLGQLLAGLVQSYAHNMPFNAKKYAAKFNELQHTAADGSPKTILSEVER